MMLLYFIGASTMLLAAFMFLGSLVAYMEEFSATGALYPRSTLAVIVGF